MDKTNYHLVEVNIATITIKPCVVLNGNCGESLQIRNYCRQARTRKYNYANVTSTHNCTRLSPSQATSGFTSQTPPRPTAMTSYHILSSITVSLGIILLYANELLIHATLAFHYMHKFRVPVLFLADFASTFPPSPELERLLEPINKSLFGCDKAIL